MRRYLLIGLIAILIIAATIHFVGVTAETLVVFVVVAFAGGFFLGRGRANNR